MKGNQMNTYVFLDGPFRRVLKILYDANAIIHGQPVLYRRALRFIVLIYNRLKVLVF